MPDNIITQSIDNTIQSQVTQDPNGGHGSLYFVNWFATGNSLIAPWWSPTRDAQLRQLWKKSDNLSGAIYTLEAKMCAIPFSIVPVDRSIQEHVEQAEKLTDILKASAQFGDGWESFYGRFVEDLAVNDNGAFAEIIGPGNPAGALTGAPISIAHLDSAQCCRTGNAEYPVIYTDLNGEQFKLHYTRVIYASQMTSPMSSMNGVGFSAVSRCLTVAQSLIDTGIFKAEKMGSRPHRAIIVTKGGLDPKDVADAFTMAESNMDSQGLSRYSKIVVAGSSSMPESSLEKIELSSLPDGFDEESNTTMCMATIALAFGMDARELWPAMPSSATRADALIQHLKQRGKGPGQILQTTESQINYKFLPPHLRMVFDFQDDAQDRQVADIRRVRAEKRAIDAKTGAVDTRTMREQMLADGDIDKGQFEAMELRDGRLANGASVLSLFYSKESGLSPMLNLQAGAKAATDPLDIINNDPTTMLTAIGDKLIQVNKTLVSAKTDATRRDSFRAIAALTKLYEKYNQVLNSKPVELDQNGQPISDETSQIYSVFIDNEDKPAVANTNQIKPINPLVHPISREQRRNDAASPSDTDRTTPTLHNDTQSTERDNKPV